MAYFNRTQSSSPLILLVDDDINMVKLLRSNLETEGFRVIYATDGITGNQTACDSKPDLIISDIFMPGVDGLEMVGRIQQRPEMREVPVIFISGQASDNVTPRQNLQTNFALLKKPIFLPELNLLIRRFLDAV